VGDSAERAREMRVKWQRPLSEAPPPHWPTATQTTQATQNHPNHHQERGRQEKSTVSRLQSSVKRQEASPAKQDSQRILFSLFFCLWHNRVCYLMQTNYCCTCQKAGWIAVPRSYPRCSYSSCSLSPPRNSTSIWCPLVYGYPSKCL